jgi:hypothetical protein
MSPLEFWSAVLDLAGQLLGQFIDLWIQFWADLMADLARKALLLLIYAQYVFLLAMAVGTYGALVLVASAFGDEGQTEIDSTSISIQGKYDFTFKYELGEKYIGFLKDKIPTVEFTYELGSMSTVCEFHYFTLLLAFPAVAFFDLLNDTSHNAPSYGDMEDFFKGVGDIMSLTGAGMGVGAAILEFEKREYMQAIGIALDVLGIVGSIITLIKYIENDITLRYLLGFMLGGTIMAIINGIIMSFEDKSLGKVSEIIASIGSIYGIYEMIINNEITEDILELFDDGRLYGNLKGFTLEEIFNSPNLAPGIFAMITGTVALGLTHPSKIRTATAGLFCLSSMIMPLIAFICFCLEE